jgi:hypothetical protein
MSKGKGKKKVVVKGIARDRAFNYTSVCCKEPAKKPPVERAPSDITENKFSECGLGKWQCTKCGKNCKVTRSKVKETETETPNEVV